MSPGVSVIKLFLKGEISYKLERLSPESFLAKAYICE